MMAHLIAAALVIKGYELGGGIGVGEVSAHARHARRKRGRPSARASRPPSSALLPGCLIIVLAVNDFSLLGGSI